MNNFESIGQAGQALMEEDAKKERPVRKDQADANQKLDDVAYEDFICRVEEEILLEERNKNNNNAGYLNKYLEKIVEKKEVFLSKIESEKRKLSAKVLFEIEEIVIKNLIENKTGIRSEEFRFGDSEWQQEIIFLINKNKDNPEELQIFWDEYKALFDYENEVENGNKYMAGVMAPLALQNILQEKYGMEVTYPKPKEDVKYSIDMVAVDEQNKLNFLIQVKTNKDQIEKMINKDLNAPRNSDNADAQPSQEPNKGKKLIKVINRHEFGNAGESMHKDYKLFSEGCSKYVESNRDFFKDKGYKTTGVYIYIPYVMKSEKLIGINGEPNDKLWQILVAEGLETKLGLPKKLNYDTIIRK